jgi:hypothetical protein
MAANRDAAWLLKRQAVSVLPSVASLKALRRFARKDQGTKPMIGFGDPLFDAMQDGTGDQCAAAGFRPRPVVLLRRPAVWGPFALIGEGGRPDKSGVCTAALALRRSIYKNCGSWSRFGRRRLLAQRANQVRAAAMTRPRINQIPRDRLGNSGVHQY